MSQTSRLLQGPVRPGSARYYVNLQVHDESKGEAILYAEGIIDIEPCDRTGGFKHMLPSGVWTYGETATELAIRIISEREHALPNTKVRNAGPGTSDPATNPTPAFSPPTCSAAENAGE